jgi:mRNA-degrading endonuclease RelE of RelBE toxin-antitoxin system
MGERAEVLFTLEFKRSLRHLSKRYRNVRRELDPFIERLAAGETPGDRVRGVEHVVYKVRLANPDAGRGKSGGYRVLYYVQTAARVILVTIYSKSDQGDVSAAALGQILRAESGSGT